MNCRGTSPYSTPILFEEKQREGGLQFCIDYRSLNANTVTDLWPLLRNDELLACLKGAHYFSKLDLRNSYYQIPLAE